MTWLPAFGYCSSFEVSGMTYIFFIKEHSGRQRLSVRTPQEADHFIGVFDNVRNAMRVAALLVKGFERFHVERSCAKVGISKKTFRTIIQSVKNMKIGRVSKPIDFKKELKRMNAGN